MGRFKTKREALKKKLDKKTGKQAIFNFNETKKGFRTKVRKADLDKMGMVQSRIRQKV